MNTREWRELLPRIQDLAVQQGLAYNPVEFETVPESFMMEIAVYGLPVRMPHWSFGVRYISQLIQHRMGHSRLFEVVFPGNPGRAYLARGNSLAENILVTAHVLGHADFSRSNLIFRDSQRQVGEHIVEQAATHARQIAMAIEEHGQEKVEAVLDAALALEQHIDLNHEIGREPYPQFLDPKSGIKASEFGRRFAALDPQSSETKDRAARRRAPIPPHPEKDLLWFIAQYAPELDGWERDIFLAVREESFYFYPVYATQIMNEGWASYWHARLLREADFLPQHAYVDAIKCHSDVVRPIASGEKVALAINPYHLGFSIWEDLVAKHGLAAARRTMQEDDDASFVRNHLTLELANELQLFRYKADTAGSIKVQTEDLTALHEELARPKYNFGAPSIAAAEVQVDGTLVLAHDHHCDGRGIDIERAAKVLEYIQRVWRRPVLLKTIDGDGRPVEIKTP
ncbi:MAG: SpoVR family protein [Proteobacteria bacterium]|nr:SpoVR family protein [Pseudomonadota bacterium]